jgi:hypothetical protein
VLQPRRPDEDDAYEEILDLDGKKRYMEVTAAEWIRRGVDPKLCGPVPSIAMRRRNYVKEGDSWALNEGNLLE